MKADVYGISRAVWPWNSLDAVHEKQAKGRPLFGKMEDVGKREYPLCSGCKLPECRDRHPACRLRCKK